MERFASEADGGTDRMVAAGDREQAALEAQLRRLSRRNVVRITSDGPVFAHPARSRVPNRDTFAPVLGIRDRLLVAALTIAWGLCFVWFWMWWLQPEHRIGWAGLIVNSVLLLYLTSLPCYFLIAVGRLRRVAPSLEIPRTPVAFVVTHAPSEEWTTARRTLRAMLRQKFPHPYDVWLCDEDPTPETLDWCRDNGVRVSCRRGVAAYHRAAWPRRTKCKEGNLAYFYDHWGYRQYAVVAQLDCDHVPSPTYLAEMVRPFADPAIGYVAAPSVCDSNAAGSWAARGRMHREAPYHGPCQLGHANRLAPMCIGSHYAVRTRALRDIGGIGPELAEDFSTTFLLHSAGWHGAFAIDAEAHGEGPLTFADMVTQEFQWSRSLTTMLLGLLPRHLGRLPALLRLRFAYALWFYPLLALTIGGGLLLSPIAVAAGLPWINVSLIDFLFHFWPLSACLLTTLLLMRRRGLLRPSAAPVLSWEGWLFALARWPFVAWGVLTAILQKVRPRPVVFKVTPKVRNGCEPLLTRVVAPFALIAVMLSAVAIFGEMTGPQAGYVFLCLLGASAHATVAVAVPLLHVLETSRAAGTPLRSALATARLPIVTGVAVLLPLAFAVRVYPPYLRAVLGW